MATITPPKIYRPTKTIWCGLFIVDETNLLWCDGNRRSSLGGYIGTFRKTYLHSYGHMISPTGEQFQIKMEHVEVDAKW